MFPTSVLLDAELRAIPSWVLLEQVFPLRVLLMLVDKREIPTPLSVQAFPVIELLPADKR
jgi:hypothetical protein